MWRSARDRTQDFFSAVQALQSAGGGAAAGSVAAAGAGFAAGLATSTITHRRPAVEGFRRTELTGLPEHRAPAAAAATGAAARAPVEEKSKFTVAAQRLREALGVIDKNLDDLARLVRNRSLFVDQTANINALTARARDDIKELEVGVKALEEYLQQAQSANPQIESQRRAVAQSLRGDLLNATKRFAELLQERTASLRDRNERQRSLYDGLMGSQHLRKRQVGALLLEEEKQPLVEDGPQGASAPQQQQQQRVHEEEDAYLRSRSQAVESIETVLRELAQIMQRLNIMLAQQHETAIRIDQNMDDTLNNVEEGHKQLLKAFQNVSSNRALIIKVFAFLIAFAIFFIVFVA